MTNKSQLSLCVSLPSDGVQEYVRGEAGMEVLQFHGCIERAEERDEVRIDQGPKDPHSLCTATGVNLGARSFLLGKDKTEKGNSGSNEKGKNKGRSKQGRGGRRRMSGGSGFGEKRQNSVVTG
ncbi:hypothetical protein KUCAC02_014391 [Chaenocephalus aceratus]|uniref:Uncharacterized protein n=1 Tax=Chaenocephalus aceratus TaxID=36190 RepID=A0ACB9WEI6_CHAAC|nr:hypothetical protein KUCAC02_014391 [Chaenocephalus aceratus]